MSRLDRETPEERSHATRGVGIRVMLYILHGTTIICRVFTHTIISQ